MLVQLPENLLRLVKVAENKHPAPIPYCFKSVNSTEQDAELQSTYLFHKRLRYICSASSTKLIIFSMT